ncbi:MAG TPA: DEAD/DEAH box helicase [Chromatiales bacterium]|nr:DEAD/DEAH box helicase [Chromatiales bacterium]
MSFSELGLSDSVLRAVAEAGYVTPTPIQKQAIPQILMGRDVLGCAQTGTGKTASFTLPMIDILSEGRARARMPRSLILEPTRELAAQVEQNFETYGKYSKLTTALLIGGVSFADQEKKLDRGVEVLIATPGRLLDHFERGKVLLNDVSFLVIDEADRMLDMGFIPDVERIVGRITKSHQTLFFSATMPPEIRRLADRFLNNPKEISVSPPATVAETVEQAMVVVAHRDKRAALRALLRTQPVKNALIFCNRKRDVGVLHRSLARHGFDVGALHGDMDQFQRTATLGSFKKGEIALLVCSDVAARGLDIAGVSHVFNFDVPSHAEDYVHRTGRTGRAGRTGHAYTLATPEDGKYIAAIQKLVGRDIPRIDIEDVAGAELQEEEGKSRRRKSRPEKAERPARDEKSVKREETKDRSSRRRGGKGGSRRRKDDDAGDAPEYKDTPFGETDQVPDFLKRRAGV